MNYTQHRSDRFRPRPGGGAPGWEGPQAALGCVIHPGGLEGAALWLLFNARVDEVWFQPTAPAGGTVWAVSVDTAQRAPVDVYRAGQRRRLRQGEGCHVAHHSLKVLIGA